MRIQSRRNIKTKTISASTLARTKVVCLGGGVGTVNLVRGLRSIFPDITVVASMADEGASGGRLRRLFKIPPPGDLINCLHTMSDADPGLKKLLTYRFAGDRWGRDDAIGGQKLGNLMLVALTKTEGSFAKGLEEAMRIFACRGKILPVTYSDVTIWAKTVDGKKIVGEETIDLGKYNGKRQLSEIHISPPNIKTTQEVLKALRSADLIIAGPGDLYTTILPVLLVKQIAEAVKRSSARKVFVVNVANKPFETPDYRVTDYLSAVKKHLGTYPFDYTLININHKPRIPHNLHYHYVQMAEGILPHEFKTNLVATDLVDRKFSLYHDSDRLAKSIVSLL